VRRDWRRVGRGLCGLGSCLAAKLQFGKIADEAQFAVIEKAAERHAVIAGLVHRLFDRVFVVELCMLGVNPRVEVGQYRFAQFFAFGGIGDAGGRIERAAMGRVQEAGVRFSDTMSRAGSVSGRVR